MYIFDEIARDPVITQKLERTKELSRGRYMNEHGPEHALAVSNYAIGLFNLLIRSNYLTSKLEEEESLVVTLAACYVHDIGRWAKDKHDDKALMEINGLLKPFFIKKYPEPNQRDRKRQVG